MHSVLLASDIPLRVPSSICHTVTCCRKPRVTVKVYRVPARDHASISEGLLRARARSAGRVVAEGWSAPVPGLSLCPSDVGDPGRTGEGLLNSKLLPVMGSSQPCLAWAALCGHGPLGHLAELRLSHRVTSETL